MANTARRKPPAAGRGRPKGALNKATREIKAFALEFLNSDDYMIAMKRRVIAGKAPHLETLLYHYGYGKPKDSIQLDGHVGVDIKDARESLASKLAGLATRTGAGGVAGESE